MRRYIIQPRFAVILSFISLSLFFSTQVNAFVISQIYGGGGNSGALFSHDFIEIFNNSSTAMDLSGMSVQYATASGSTWHQTDLGGTLLAPFEYYLIEEGGSSLLNGASLPTPDTIGTINFSASSGKIALVNNTNSLSVACPSVSILDFVGYGSANCYEGSAVGNLSNTTASMRLQGGLTDTGNNAADFEILAPNPRNTGFPQNFPSGNSSGQGIVPLTEPSSLMLVLAGILLFPLQRCLGPVVCRCKS